MKHAILGASSAARWKACPGSVREIAQLTHKPESSPYALEGNAAHSAAEWCLVNRENADALAGQWVHPEGALSSKKAKGYFEVDEEMVGAVQVYVDEVKSHLNRLSGAELLVEQTVKPLPERDDMFGTADAIIIEPYGELVVLDFKYGRGVTVEVEWNDQAMFYALGALERVGDDGAVSKVTIVIVQPRAFHEDGVIRRWTASVEDIRAEADQLRSAARATEDPAAPLIPGEKQCRFCPAAATCPALRQVAVSMAVDDFDDVTPTVRLPDPEDPQQIARALKLADLIDTWGPAVRAMAKRLADRGVEIPGHKLVRTAKHRQWKDEQAVLAALQTRGLSPERYLTTPKLKSPAQLDKVAGKAWVAEHTFRPEGETILVPDTDKRPAALPAVIADFPEDNQ